MNGVGPAKALVCEDDPAVRRVITTVLEQLGVSVIAEIDMLSNVPRLVRYGGPDIVILDLVLVGTSSGHEALADLADMAKSVTVVVFSAHDTLRDQALAAGAYAFVDKPDFDRLAAVVAEVVTATAAG